ncbi:MAG: GNAT family N-acetyltransferase [Acidobacteriales bacterium]|nr:GNAT family N-acetyltransferase [Terriglobales bacterium]
MNPVLIREAVVADAPALVPMCGQLGYVTTAGAVEQQIRRIQSDPEGQVLVAEVAGMPVGWIHVQIRHTLHAPPYPDVTGLVVEDQHRGQNIGAGLLARAERWAVDAGFKEIRLRSNIKRERAHHFYESLGYTMDKTSLNFRKPLTGEG